MPQTSIQQLLPNTPANSTASTGIGRVVLASGGTGYTEPPMVTASGPSSAAVLGSLVENGVVTSIVVQQPGTGCVTVPTVTIAPPPGAGTQATVALVVLNNAIIGTARQAAGYILAGRTLQTVSWRYTDVIARVSVQATLESDPDTTNWTTVLFSDLRTDDPNQGITDTDYANIQGSWVWVRVLVENFVQGTIEYIKLSY